MCFKNLPIEFDEAGKAQLKAGVKDPYSVTIAEPKGYVRRKEGPGAQLAAPPRLTPSTSRPGPAASAVVSTPAARR